jgi:hypothetical protein
VQKTWIFAMDLQLQIDTDDHLHRSPAAAMETVRGRTGDHGGGPRKEVGFACNLAYQSLFWLLVQQSEASDCAPKANVARRRKHART